MSNPVKLLEVPNFLNNPNAIRNQALKGEWQDFVGYDEEVYKRVQLVDLPEVRAKIEHIFGPCEFLGTGFRLNYNDELPNAAIHSDLGWGTHAMVLYLSEGPGGTAFWFHRETLATEINEGDTALFHKVKSDWDDVSKWEQYMLANSAYNKAIFYEGKYFHSRWPFEAYGTDASSGRLIAVAFFTPLNT